MKISELLLQLIIAWFQQGNRKVQVDNGSGHPQWLNTIEPYGQKIIVLTNKEQTG